MEFFAEQLQETTDPAKRVALIAPRAEEFVFKDMERATVLLKEALPLAKKLTKNGYARSDYARLLLADGWRHSNRAEYKEAEKRFAEALQLAEKIGERKLVAYALHALGSAALVHGDYTRALDY